MSNDDRQPTSGDEREQFRVTDEVLLDYEAMEAHELEHRRERAAGQWPSAFMLSSRLHEIREETIVLRRHATQESKVYSRLIDAMDRKIELLAEVLMVQAFGDRHPFVSEISVGAGGMDFLAPTPEPVDGLLDIRMVFRSTGIGIRVFGAVRHCEPADNRRHRVGVEFIYAREHDRELLVYQVLQRQSQQLRERQ